MRNLICGIPDKILVPWLKNKTYLAVAEEGEAIAIGVGYYLATKKTPTIFMSADGFANALNPIANIVIPQGIKMHLVISYGRKELPHYVMSDSLIKIIEALPYEPTKLHFEFIKQ